MSTFFKKVISALSVATVTASVVGSSLVAAANGFLPYADALATKGYIVKATEAGYRLNDNASRQEAAGIALKLAGVTLPDNYTCKKYFSDVTATSPASWSCRTAELAVDNKIASKENAKFRPLDNITRAEALAFILKAAKIETPAVTKSSFNDVTVQWQKNVSEAALAKKIISPNASFRPNASVTRGELFVFAANALGLEIASSDEEELNLDDLFGDNTGSTSTGSTGSTSTGETTIVKAGDLNVSLNPASPASGTQVPKAGIVRFGVVDFKASSTSDVSVNTVEVGKAGLSTIASSTRIWFEKNGLRVSGKASFSSENVAVISFAPALVVKAGATESIDLYVELNTTSGTDFQFASKSIGSTAQNVAGSFTTPTLRTADYSVATATIVSNGSPMTYNASGDNVEFGKFSIANTDANSDTRDVKFQSVTLYQSGSADLTNLSNITVERNGVVVSKSATVSGKALTLVMDDIIKDGATAIYTIKAVVTNVEQTTDTYQLYLKNTSDINLIETATAFRATISSTTPVSSNLYTVNGGDVKFERDTSVALSQNAAPGTADVILMQGTITAKSAVTLEDVTMNYAINGSANTGAADVLNTVYLQIGGSTLTWTPAVGAAKFYGITTVTGTAKVKMYAKLKDTAPAATTIKFDDLKRDSFTTKEYVSNQNAVTSAIGSIGGSTITVNASTLSVARTDGLGATKLPVGAKGILVYQAKFSSTQGNPIALSNLSVTTSGDALSYTGGNTSLTLYVDGVAKSTKSLNTASVTFDGFNVTVSSTPAVTHEIAIKADFSDLTNIGTFQVASINYDAVDNQTSGTISAISVAGAVFTVAEGAGALSSSDQSPKKALLLAGAKDQKLLAFKVTASNDAVTLKDLALTGAKLSNFTNVRLTDANLTVIGTANNLADTSASFANLDNAASSTIAVDKSPVFYVIADVNTTTDVLNTMVGVVPTGSTIKTSNGATKAMGGVAVSSALHDIAQNTAKIAQVTPTSKDLTTDAMEFSITAAGKNNVTLSGVTFNNTVSGYVGSMVLSVYKKSDNTLVGSVNATSGVISFNAGTTVDAGTTTTYVVKMVGATVDAAAQSQGWTISLTGLEVNTGVNTVDLKNYPSNVDTLPINSTK